VNYLRNKKPLETNWGHQQIFTKIKKGCYYYSRWSEI